LAISTLPCDSIDLRTLDFDPRTLDGGYRQIQGNVAGLLATTCYSASGRFDDVIA
jgi:hypothetical protein